MGSPVRSSWFAGLLPEKHQRRRGRSGSEEGLCCHSIELELKEAHLETEPTRWRDHEERLSLGAAWRNKYVSPYVGDG
jgi:hypothetical protein